MIGATVVSHDIVASDVWATSIISGGPDAAATASQRGFAVLYLDDALTVHANSAMRNLISEDTVALLAPV